MKQWDEGFCSSCGVFLGDDYREDHWCPFLLDEIDEFSELNFDIDDDSDFLEDIDDDTR